MKLRMKIRAGLYSLPALLPATFAVWAHEPRTDPPPLPGPPAPAAAPQIEVCFVLDTTGSMSGLIEGAKQKIWSIANEMIAARPRPDLRIALIGFRDRGDQYVTEASDLTEDLDAVYARLSEFRADGGGDEPESVNQALHEAVTRVSWSPDRNVLKIIFLVGDSPPHMDYPDDVKYLDTCRLAMQKDLIINTVQCGRNLNTTPIWEEIARRAEGGYASIGQTGDMRVVSTPVDASLAALNTAIGETLVPYGSVEQQHAVAAKQAVSEVASAPAAADRLAYNVARGRGVQGRGDLIDDLKQGIVKLADLDREDLPPQMRDLSDAEREAYVQRAADQRRQLQARAEELLKERQDYLDTESAKRRTGSGDAFDEHVTRLLRTQAARKGIHYDDVSTRRPSPESSSPEAS